MPVCIRCIVSGRVQGVFYRAATQAKASELALSGWARNLPDGSVEVLACGGAESLEKFQDWLWKGPQHARVTGIRCESVEEPDDLDGFEVR